MAIHPNESKANRHCLVLGKSGSGKTYWLKHQPLLKRRGVRLLVWDPYESHDCAYFRDRRQFARHVALAVKSGRGFRLGLSVHPDPEAFEWFCRIAWAALDGRRDTVIMVEELGDVSKPGKAGQNWGQLVRVGRKYGAILLAVSQRPQEIDKTLFTQVARVWCGLVSSYDQAYCERHIGLPRGALGQIKPGSYEFVLSDGHSHKWGGPKKRKITL